MRNNHSLQNDLVREQILRKILFYSSIAVFCLVLPFILSFMLGYKFDRSKLHFTKTGILALKTDPSGASVVINGKLYKDKTPLTIQEMLPGTYTVELKLSSYFPWKREIMVEAGKVLRFESIILFLQRPDVTNLAREKITAFFIDDDTQDIYYASEAEGALYRSDNKGKNFEKIAPYLSISPAPQHFKLSPDKKTILYFNNHQIGIVTFDAVLRTSVGRYDLVLDYPGITITDIFWHSTGKYLVVVTTTGIAVLEIVPEAQLLQLVTLSRKGTSAFYDTQNDTLYFLDTQKARDGTAYDNLYKFEVNTHTPLFMDFIKLRPQEKKPVREKKAE